MRPCPEWCGIGRAAAGYHPEGVTDLDDLRKENATLRERVAALTKQLADAELRLDRDVTERENVEEALKESELRYRRLVEELPEAVVVQIDGKIAFANAAAARAFGLPAPDALVGRTIDEFATPETRVRIEQRRRLRLQEGEQHVLVEHTFVDPRSGREFHVEVKSIGIRYAGKAAVLSIARDVTERVQAAREHRRLIASLAFERNRFGTLLQKVPAFVAVLRGKDHVYELANDAYRELLGGRDLIGKPAIEAVPEIRDQGFIERLDRVFETGEAFVGRRLPLSVLNPGEAPRLRYVDFIYQAIVEADGTRSGILSHGVDVTDVTVAEQRLRAQFHGVPLPTYVWQRVVRDGKEDFVLVDYNKAALEISRGGIAREIGQTATAFFTEDPSTIADLEKCLAEGTTFQREVTRTMKSTGETKWLFVTYSCAPPDLVLVHTEDITARATLEQQFRQAQKLEAVGRLAGGVAHDFNNLLSVIMTYTLLALETLAEDDALREDLSQIGEAAARASELTKQLLAFSRQQILEPRVLDLNETVGQIQRLLARLLGEDIELRVHPGGDLGRVVADPTQIEQIVMNLALNARDAMPRGGKLTIETANIELDGSYASAHVGVAPGRYVLLAVSDTGTGMSPATVARVFEPFFTTKEPGKGTGLGLATVFGIVQQSGGHVGVYSEEGRGSVFKVYLPRTDSPLDAPEEKSASGVMSGSETILLVEDAAPVRAVASNVLRRSGYHVLEAADGSDALRVARGASETKIDLLLTDVVMPKMSGRELAEELGPLRPEMKVLFASGYTDDAIVHHGVLEAGVAFLQKPFTPETLLRKVRGVLDGPPTSRRGRL